MKSLNIYIFRNSGRGRLAHLLEDIIVRAKPLLRDPEVLQLAEGKLQALGGHVLEVHWTVSSGWHVCHARIFLG